MAVSRTPPKLPSPSKVVAAMIEAKGGSRAVDPNVFVGAKEWLPEVVKQVVKELPSTSSPDLRVRPMAVVRSVRSGKTRALKELVNALRRKGTVALFASFNGDSQLMPTEADLTEALLRRVTFELCRDRVAWDECGAGDIDAFLAACGQRNVVLVIDELSVPLPPGKVTDAQRTLWQYLRNTFLLRARRGLVFSSHFPQTVAQAAQDFLGIQTARKVNVIAPPMISDVDQAAAELGVTVDAQLKWGLLPAMVLEQDVMVQRVQDKCPAQFDVVALAQACLTGREWKAAPTELLVFGQMYEVDNVQMYAWPPAVIACMLGEREPERFGALRSWIVGPHKQGAGEFWEAIVMLGVLLHRLAGLDNENIPHLPRVTDWRFLEVPKVLDVDGLIKWATERLKGRPQYVLAYPTEASFGVYDAVELVWRDGRYRVISGLQMKEGAKTPSAAAVSVRLSLLLSRKTPLITHGRTDGWLKIPRVPLEDLLGASLSVVLPALGRRGRAEQEEVRFRVLRIAFASDVVWFLRPKLPSKQNKNTKKKNNRTKKNNKKKLRSLGCGALVFFWS